MKYSAAIDRSPNPIILFQQLAMFICSPRGYGQGSKIMINICMHSLAVQLCNLKDSILLESYHGA